MPFFRVSVRIRLKFKFIFAKEVIKLYVFSIQNKINFEPIFLKNRNILNSSKDVKTHQNSYKAHKQIVSKFLCMQKNAKTYQNHGKQTQKIVNYELYNRIKFAQNYMNLKRNTQMGVKLA